jgi:hypothetical protein
MDERPISSIPTEEFDAIIEAYIERETKDTGELDAPIFYEAFREWVKVDIEAEDIEVEGTIVDNQLILSVPLDPGKTLQLDDVEIFVRGRRIAVKVKDETIYPTAH